MSRSLTALDGVNVGAADFLAAVLEAVAQPIWVVNSDVAKHSGARGASVTARVEDGTLQVRVRDDGVGGAAPDGNGLVGLADRLAVLDGRLEVESPIDGGTLVVADIPVRA